MNKPCVGSFDRADFLVAFSSLTQIGFVRYLSRPHLLSFCEIPKASWYVSQGSAFLVPNSLHNPESKFSHVVSNTAESFVFF